MSQNIGLLYEFRQPLYSTIPLCFDVLQFTSTHSAVTLVTLTSL